MPNNATETNLFPRDAETSRLAAGVGHKDEDEKDKDDDTPGGAGRCGPSPCCHVIPSFFLWPLSRYILGRHSNPDNRFGTAVNSCSTYIRTISNRTGTGGYRQKRRYKNLPARRPCLCLPAIWTTTHRETIEGVRVLSDEPFSPRISDGYCRGTALHVLSCDPHCIDHQKQKDRTIASAVRLTRGGFGIR